MTQTRISSVMRTDILLLTEEAPIRTAAARLVDARAAAAPVVADDVRMVGLLTQKDCFRSALHASYYREWSGRVADHMSTNIVTV